VAPRERRGGPPLLKLGPPREPCLLPSGPPQPSLTALPSGLLEMPGSFEGSAVRQDTGLDNAPPGHEPLARQRDHPDPAQAAPPVAKALLLPRRERTRWLNTPPAPGHLHGHRADVRVPGVGDATRIGGVPTRIGSRCQAPESPHFLAMTTGPPAEAFHDKDPGPLGPDPFQGQEWPPLFPHRLRARLEHRTACGFQLGAALGQRLAVLPLLAEPLSESRRERGAIPQAEGLQRRLAVSARGHPQAWRREPPREAIDHARPIPCRGRSGARPVTAVFFRHPGDADDTPHPLCPCDVAQEPGEPLVHLEAIRLRPTVTASDRKAGRVYDAVLHPLGLSTAVEPTAIPARLVATDDAGVMGSSTPRLGPSHLLLQDLESTRRHRARPRPRRRPSREAKFPGHDAEFKGQKQGRPRWSCLILAGRHGCSHRWTPSFVVQPMGS
jgi:hypothetical protein